MGGKADNGATEGIIDKVWVIPGCIVCNVCEDTSPDVFHVTDTTTVVKMDSQARWNDLSEEIIAATDSCPVNVIKFELKK